MTDVVIIGAGMASIACARALRAAALPVRLIDKGRGIGGRMASRRADIGGDVVTFDHGAQCLDQSEGAAGRRALGNWPWGPPTFRHTGYGGPVQGAGRGSGRHARHASDRRYRARRWLGDHDRGGQSACNACDANRALATALADFLGATHPAVAKTAEAVMLPCLTLMAALEPDTPAPIVTQCDPDAVLSRIAWNDSRPGSSSAHRTWVAQAHPSWSAAHIDPARDMTKVRMVALLCETLAVNPSRLCHADLQGWRYGLVSRPLGQPFARQGPLWVGGDWCVGPKAQDAWRSSTEIARDVLQTLSMSQPTQVAEADPMHGGTGGRSHHQRLTDLLSGMFGERLQDSNFRNEDLTRITRETFEDIICPDLGEFVHDGLVTSALISGALQARAMLGGQAMSPAQMRSHLELAGIGVGTAVTVDALISML